MISYPNETIIEPRVDLAAMRRQDNIVSLAEEAHARGGSLLNGVVWLVSDWRSNPDEFEQDVVNGAIDELREAMSLDERRTFARMFRRTSWGTWEFKPEFNAMVRSVEARCEREPSQPMMSEAVEAGEWLERAA